MSYGATYMVGCSACRSLQPVDIVVTERHDDGTPAAWEYRCATCGATFGFGMDGGTLDLATVQAPPDPGITVYSEPPWNG